MAGELLPTLQAQSIQESLSEYLTTTFSLADRGAQQALDDFLTDSDTGIFKGPYLRTRTPFAPTRDAVDVLDIPTGPFDPYGHQAAAFARLTSKGLAPHERPQPTLVTTGTGSGKTESFLYPILDHVRRHKRHGGTGMSALILYPMNALALDQAQRLARMLVDPANPELAGIRAGFYVGESGDAKRSMVTSDGLITDRHAMQENPPDILLTNYKMLDRLLLRPADQRLWDESALSLQYLVLDEFHTYDGAQGTDVAMLLRRLGAALKRRWPDEHPTLTPEHRARPLGRITPVATSATLGDEGDPTAILEFARTVFGEAIDRSAVVTESRYSVDAWAGLTPDPLVDRQGASVVDGFDSDELRYQRFPSIDADAALAFITRDRSSATGGSVAVTDPRVQIVRTAATLLTTQDQWPALAAALGDATAHRTQAGAAPTADVPTENGARPSDQELHPALPELIRHHPAVQELARATVRARPLDTLAAELRIAPDYLSCVIALLSAVRASAGRAALTVDAHLWVREVSRIDRVAGGSPEFRWFDDAVTDVAIDAEQEWDDNLRRASFPAVFCRNCGRSGWAVQLSPDGGGLDNPERDKDIRKGRVQRNERVRVLLTADGEAEAYATSDPDNPVLHPFLRDFNAPQRTITKPDAVFGPIPPSGELAEELAAGQHLPVLVDLTDDGGPNAVKDVCPACGERDTIRFLGAAIATLLSVCVSTLFGDEHLDDGEKKSLVFTDSVQDAAHRAGFIEARSHTFTTRAVLAAAAQDHCTLADIADRAIQQAGEDSFARYRLLAPQLTDGRFESVERWWRQPRTANRAGYDLVRRRLAFDAALEFGLQSRVGRTLELTGTAQAEVDLPDAAELDAVTAALFEDEGGQATGIVPSADERIAWVRGVAEHLRMRGAIHHEWLDRYVKDAGRRYLIWGGRRRDQGMPAFPAGRAAPVFAYAGAKPGGFATEFEKLDEANGWYGRYAARVLGVDRRHGAALTGSLLRALAQHDERGRGAVRTSAALERRATVFGLEPSRVRLSAEEDPATLLCTVCQTEFPMGARARAELDGTACLLVTCSGTLETRAIDSNFYRDLYTGSNLRRVVAREHSSILDAAERKKTEDGFKTGGHDPSSANVLVATPTLEMGIDIGDLSTVLLSSLPPTVANYVQRVGRAGRLTGNALTVAFVEGRGRQRPMLADPLAVIDGAVRPPATYLDAVEIIERQYLAFLFDRVAMDPERHGIAAQDYPRTATALFGNSPEASTLLSAVLDLNAQQHEALLDEFLAGFGDQIDLAARELRAWAAPGEDGASGLSRTVWAAHRDYLRRRETLTRRKTEIQPVVLRLKEQKDAGHLPEEEKEPLQQAMSALRATERALTDMQTQDWVSALETVQLLPNYTLLDDSTDLEVIARWRDDETAEWREDSLTFGRGSRVALRDFAPGSTFYGRGLQVRVDAVDLGAANEDVYTLAFCSACGFTHDSREARVTEDGTATLPQQCPRCGSAGIADRGQRVDAVQFRRAMSMINRDEAGINDRDDDRAMTMYSLVSLADIDPTAIASRWYTPGLDFGIAHLSRVRITTVNLGQQRRARPAVIAGEEMPLSLFTVCESCGVLDRSSGENSRKEHRPWCPLRDARDEKTVSIALTHLLDTQGALLRLPHDLVTGDHLTVPSLMAALQVGLREELGGEPDHISLLRTQEPLEGGGVVEALLLHDVVPGGTGYLADLCRPEKLWNVLTAAYRVVRDCVCAGTEIACAQCLLPFVPPGSEGMVSRQSAETTLATLLRAGRTADGSTTDATCTERPRGDASPGSADGGAGGEGGLGDGIPWTGWEVTTETPERPADDSALEGKFRAVMRERLTHVGYHVRETAMSTGTGLTFTLPQSQLRWRLVPQVAQGFVKPDFMLECASPQVPDVAVFTDGYAYHASPAHTIVADDAWKRAELRSRNGWPVVSIAHADVVASAMTDGSVSGTVGGAEPAGGAGGAAAAGARAGFWGHWHAQTQPETLHALKSRKAANGQRMLTWPDGAEAYLAGPVEILLQWILTIDEAQTSGGTRGMGAGSGDAGQSPVEAAVGAVRAFADSAAWMLGVGRAGLSPHPVLIDVSAGSVTAAQQLAGELTQEEPLVRPDGHAPDAGWQMAFLLREGPLGILFAPDPDGSGRARLAIVLDDRESAVGMQGFRDAWIAWLHLSTLLSFSARTDDVVVTTVLAIGESRGVAGAAPATEPAGEPVVDFVPAPGTPAAPVAVGWEHLQEDENLLDEERTFIDELMVAGVGQPPEVGVEIESGLQLSLSWPQQKIAILLEPEPGDIEEAEDDGWTVVSADADTVKRVLEDAGAENASGRDADRMSRGEN